MPFGHPSTGGEGEEEDVEEGVVEITVGEEEVDAVSLESFFERSKTENINEEKNFAKEEGKERGASDGSFFAGFEGFPPLEVSRDSICQ